MSHVDNVILSFDVLEDEDARIAEVNAWLAEHGANCGTFEARLGDIAEAYGGRKRLEVPIYVAAFNYLPEFEFLGALRRMSWQYPESVAVMICRQHSRRFEMIYPCADLGSA